MPQYPEYIRRKDDGELLKINRQTLLYSFVNSKMCKPFEYSFELLMHDPRYKDHFEIIKEDKMFKLNNYKDLINEMYMSDMKPLDIAVIVGGDYDSEIVMRPAGDTDRFMVMSLSKPGTGNWWDLGAASHHKVKLLPKGTKVTLEVI